MESLYDIGVANRTRIMQNLDFPPCLRDRRGRPFSGAVLESKLLALERAACGGDSKVSPVAERLRVASGQLTELY